MMTTGPRRPPARFWAGVSAAHGARLRTDGYFAGRRPTHRDGSR